MEKLTQDLQAASLVSAQKDKETAYIDVLTAALQPNSSAGMDGVIAVIDHVSSENVSLAISRALFSAFANQLPSLDAEVGLKAGLYALNKLQSRVVSFEEQVSIIRQHLAAIYESKEQWSEAARMLIGIPLDGHRNVTNNFKLDIYLKIAQLYLEDDNSVDAETYVNRAAMCQQDATDKVLQLKYKVCYARILDAKRKFVDAANRYYELSTLIAESERMLSLSMAMTCVILAPVSAQRSRILANIYKDERSQRIPSYNMLENMFLSRFISKAAAAQFAEKLAPHQLAKLADGSTILDRTITEHNVLCASKLYKNISFEELGLLLEISPEAAESIAARMVSEQRMTAVINQISRFIFFEDSTSVLPAWDEQIASLCNKVNDIYESIEAQYPEWLAANP